MDIVDFLFPRELEVSKTPLRKLLIVGSCLAEAYARDFAWKNPEIQVKFSLFNYVQELEHLDSVDATEIDLVLLHIPLRSLIGDKIERFADIFRSGRYPDLLADAETTLDAMLTAGMQYTDRIGLLTLVSNFIVPQREVARSLKEAGGNLSITTLIRSLNERISEHVRSRQNAYVADVNALAAGLGKGRILDDWWHIYAHNSAMPHNWNEGTDRPFFLNKALPPIDNFHEVREHEFYNGVWRQIETMYRTIRQVDQVKLVVFDLDNTLWRGQIAEHYADGGEWADACGWPEGIVEAVHHLRARGIMVAISSKNDANVVEKHWDRPMSRGHLGLGDFVTTRINWRPKAENVAEIIHQVGLTPKSVVFVDDNPIERESVRSQLPGIRVIGENQFLTRRILLWSAETQVAFISAESERREVMMKSQISRDETRASLSREEFLCSLDCSLALFRVDTVEDSRFGRVYELLNKTNQFNTTGKRWKFAELVAFMSAGGSIYCFNLADRFVEYGLVGIVLIKGTHFEQYVMSCRVLGLDIEPAVICEIIRQSRLDEGTARFTALVIPTEFNHVSRDVFQRAGFAPSARDDGWFEIDPRQVPPLPQHLRLAGATAVAV